MGKRCFALQPMLLFVLMGVAIMLGSSYTYAAQVTLRWNANRESDIAGYRLHYGTSSRGYQFSVDVGNRTNYTISGLTNGQMYYFAATAYDIHSNESDYSEEVLHVVETAENQAPPGVATLTLPSGTIPDSTPTYTWHAVSGSTWYYLWVNGPSSNVMKQWYASEDVCSGDTCSVAPLVTLANGDHTWWVRTWNECGDGPWSAPMDFTVWDSSQAPPGAAALTSPSGTISDSTPTYTWQPVSGSTWYYLWVNGPSSNVIQEWYEASDVCNGDTCSVALSVTLANGDHTWWVRTWNEYGDGPWSAPMNFEVVQGYPPIPPEATSLTSPYGTISEITPAFTWQAEGGSTWYYLWVNGPSGNVIQEWYEASDVCSGGTCSVTPSLTLADGDHTWWVRTWNQYGYGPWSERMQFSVAP